MAFDFVTSPRFGLTRCLRSTRVIGRGEEIFVNYGKTRMHTTLLALEVALEAEPDGTDTME